jgi:hypothetical protein
MTVSLVLGTQDGLWQDGEQVLDGHGVVALAVGPHGPLALVDGSTIWRREDDGWRPHVTLPRGDAWCLAAGLESLIVGTSEAHLLQVADGVAEPVVAFDEAPGREKWYTPWGAPPEVRSIATAADGTVYVNVHVGGIVRADASLAGWEPTIDVDADVHHVLADGDRLFAATAYGLAVSPDRGSTWSFETGGLHARYSRAVAAGHGWLLMSASTGPRTDRAAVYRRPLAAVGGEPFERCRDGLPEWFTGNVDTGCLAADGRTAAFGTADGRVYVSEDAGESWREAASGLGRVTCLALVRAA